MSRRKTTRKRQVQKQRSWRCPKCKSRNKLTKTYPTEGVLLHICTRCQFPQRVAVDG